FLTSSRLPNFWSPLCPCWSLSRRRRFTEDVDLEFTTARRRVIVDQIDFLPWLDEHFAFFERNTEGFGEKHPDHAGRDMRFEGLFDVFEFFHRVEDRNPRTRIGDHDGGHPVLRSALLHDPADLVNNLNEIQPLGRIDKKVPNDKW